MIRVARITDAAALALALLVSAALAPARAAGDAKGSAPTALKASADEPKRLADKLVVEDTASSGPMGDVELDATRVKEFKAAR
jgi:hypothetical protein